MKKLKVAVAGIAHVHAPGFVEMFRKYPEEAEVIGFADVPDPSGHPEESLEARIARNMHLADLPECFASVDEMLDQKPDIVRIGSAIAVVIYLMTFGISLCSILFTKSKEVEL